MRCAEAAGRPDRLASEAVTEGEPNELDADGEDVAERDTDAMMVCVRVGSSEGEPRRVEEAERDTRAENEAVPALVSERAGESVRAPTVAVRATVTERDGALVLVPRTACSVGKGSQEPSTLAGVAVSAALSVPRSASAVGKGAREPTALAAEGVRARERDGSGELLWEGDEKAVLESELEAEALREDAPEADARPDADTEGEGKAERVEVGLRVAGCVTEPEGAPDGLGVPRPEADTLGVPAPLREGAHTVAEALLTRVADRRAEAVNVPPTGLSVGKGSAGPSRLPAEAVGGKVTELDGLGERLCEGEDDCERDARPLAVSEAPPVDEREGSSMEGRAEADAVPRMTCAVGKGAQEPSTLPAEGVAAFPEGDCAGERDSDAKLVSRAEGEGEREPPMGSRFAVGNGAFEPSRFAGEAEGAAESEGRFESEGEAEGERDPLLHAVPVPRTSCPAVGKGCHEPSKLTAVAVGALGEGEGGVADTAVCE